MNLLLEQGIISEMKCGNNFAYIINDELDFLSTEYKVLQSQTNDRFIRCMKMHFNGKLELYYHVNTYKPLSDMLPHLDAEKFITIVRSMISVINDVKNNGFLSCKNIDISFKHIYVDPNTYKVGIVYLPLHKHEYDDDLSFESALRTSLVKVISEFSLISSPKTIQLAENLQNGMMSIEDVLVRIGGKVAQRTDNAVKTVIPQNERARVFKLVSLNSISTDEIIVDFQNKNEFTIGKKNTNDGIITSNKMISRVHCRIINQNGSYYVCDLESANGTFVNGIRLRPNQNFSIKDGDVIRLANSDYQVVIQ